VRTVRTFVAEGRKEFELIVVVAKIGGHVAGSGAGQGTRRSAGGKGGDRIRRHFPAAPSEGRAFSYAGDLAGGCPKLSAAG
jgi:hypothetical protein